MNIENQSRTPDNPHGRLEAHNSGSIEMRKDEEAQWSLLPQLDISESGMRINVLDFSHEQLQRLSILSHLGLLSQYEANEKPVMDLLAGCQKILAMGKNTIKDPNAHSYHLSYDHIALLKHVLADEYVQNVTESMLNTGGPSQEHLYLLQSGYYAEPR